MISVMLVDDDLPVLDFLRGSIPWKNLGLELHGTYTDPLEAQAAALQNPPDILLTDIGMPEMNGLDLIRSIRSAHPYVKAAILSCHDDFRYAQQAVRLSVNDYVLKETMTSKSIVELLTQLKEQVSAESGSRAKNQSLELEMRQNRSLLKRNFIRTTVHEPLFDLDGWKRQAAEYGLSLERSAWLPVFGYATRMQEALSRFQSGDLFLYAVENIVEEVASEQGGLLFAYSSREIILLFPYTTLLHISPIKKTEEILRRVQDCLAEYAKVPFSFLIGAPAKDERSLKEALTRLLDTRESLFYLPESSVIKAEHLQRDFGDGDLLLEQYADALEEFRRIVFEERLDGIDPFVAKWSDHIRYQRYKPVEVKEWVLKMILDVRLRLKSLQHYLSNFSAEVLHHNVMELTSMRELEDWLKQYMRQAIDWVGRVYRDSQNREILECRRFVSSQLDRRITLEDAAKHLHLHPSYLSRLFKRETGENFVEFVTRLKMEKAKELLEMTDKTIEEIAGQLAYDNKHYFSKLFKAHTGQLPSAYRNEINGKA